LDTVPCQHILAVSRKSNFLSVNAQQPTPKLGILSLDVGHWMLAVGR
jgi:hypothetical protein